MDIDARNFSEALPTVLRAIEECDFVAMDMEMTGLHADRTTMARGMDTLEERYAKVRESANKFAVLQVGLCAFRWTRPDASDEPAGNPQLAASAFNFWVFPRTRDNGRRGDVCHLFQVGSIEFLNTCDFDFNRAFRQGIPYLDEDMANAERDFLARQMERREQNAAKESQGARSRINMNDVNAASREFLAYALEQASGLINGELGEENAETKTRHVVLEPTHAFARRLVYQEIEAAYPNIHVGKHPEDNENPQGRRNEARLRFTLSGQSAAELEHRRVMSEYQRDLAALEESIGFGRVIAALRAAKKPLIGHNCLQDFCHLYGKFVRPLPPTLEEFRAGFHEAFPMAIDSKMIFENNRQLRALVPNHALGPCYETTGRQVTFLRTNPEVRLEEASSRYELAKSDTKGSQALEHEAGYDALMTGVIFGRAAAAMGMSGCVWDSSLRTWSSAVAGTSFEAHTELFNKLYLMRLSESIDLAQPNVEAERALVVRLCNFPKRTETGHLRRVLSQRIGTRDIRVTWDNDTSVFFTAPNGQALTDLLIAFATERSPEHAGRVLDDNIISNRLTFADFDVVPWKIWLAHDRDDSVNVLPDIQHLLPDHVAKRKRSPSASVDEGDVAPKRAKTDKGGCVVM